MKTRYCPWQPEEGECICNDACQWYQANDPSDESKGGTCAMERIANALEKIASKYLGRDE